MLQSETECELGQFLKNLELLTWINLVISGAVISGQYLKPDEEHKTILLSNATVNTGGSIAEVQDLTIPREKVLAWGYKED